jgi:hypothetical protein
MVEVRCIVSRKAKSPATIMRRARQSCERIAAKLRNAAPRQHTSRNRARQAPIWMDRGANLGNLKGGGQRVMWRAITAVAVLVLCGCAAQQEAFVRQREAERNAPNLDFQGPLRPTPLSKAQIKLVQQGVAGM